MVIASPEISQANDACAKLPMQRFKTFQIGHPKCIRTVSHASSLLIFLRD